MSKRKSPVRHKAASPTRPAPWPTWAALAGIAVLTCVAYWPALKGQILWDDAAHIPRADLQSWGGLARIWFEPGTTQQYYPLLFSWFWLQFQMWGEQMLGYHLVNLVLHIAAAWLVYANLRQLKIPGAALAAGVFALHPVNVESVAWVTEQKNTLSAVFYLGAMLAYLRFDASRQRSWYALSLGLFVAAVLSKTVTVTLPPALLVIFWWQRGGNYSPAGPDDPPRLSWRRDVVPLLPFFAVAAVDGLFTAWFERRHIGAEGPDFELSLLEKPLLAGRALWFYVEKLFWPVDLMFIYPRWTLDPTDWRQWLYPLGVVAALVVCWLMRTRTRAPLAGALFFIGTLFPVLGAFNVFFFRYSYVSDHFPYLASLGVIVPVAAGVALGIARLPRGARWLGIAGCAALLGVLTLLSSKQSRMYSGDAVAHYEAIIQANPDAWMAKNNLAETLLNRGEINEAVPLINDAIRLRPNYAEAYSNLGWAAVLTGKPTDATRYFRRSLELDPSLAMVHYNLGTILANTEQIQEAIHEFQEAVRLQPQLPQVRNNLGNALLMLGKPAEALEQFQAELTLQPNSYMAAFNAARAQSRLGHPTEAILTAERALQLSRAQGQAAAAEKIETWLRAFRAGELPAAPQP